MSDQCQADWITYAAGLKPCGGEGTDLAGRSYHDLSACKGACDADSQCNGLAWNSADHRCYIKSVNGVCSDSACDWGRSDKADWNWYHKGCQAATIQQKKFTSSELALNTISQEMG